MLTILPLRRSIIESSTARAQRIGPFRLIAITRSQVSSWLFTNGSILSQPALLTSTSIGPSCFAVSATASRTEAPSVTSMVTAIAPRPISAAVAAAVAGSMSATATFAPSAARRSAIALPMPLPAPVTSATFPSSPFMMRLLRRLVSAVVVLDHPAAGRELLDLGGAAAELDQLRVAEQSLDDELFHVAVAGEDMDRLGRDVGRHLGDVELADRSVGDAAAERTAGKNVGEHVGARVGERHVHAGDTALDELVLADRLTALLPLASVLE